MNNNIYKETDDAGWSFLKSPRWLGYYALIIVFSIVCVFLGNWQFERRDEARAEIARIDSNYDASAVSISEALPSPEYFNIDQNKWQVVSLTGTYTDDIFLARNRVSAGGVGSNIIQALELPTGELFFVDRGWVPLTVNFDDPATIPKPAAGEVEVVVRLRESEPVIANRGNVNNTLGSINLPSLEAIVGQPAYTGAYGQIVSESPTGEMGELALRPERDEGPHLSYALQWYVFILIVIGGAWYAASLEWKSVNPSKAELKRGQKKTKPRKMSDAEEEDAFLDAEA